MDLRDFYQLIMRNLVLTLLSAVAGVAVAAGITYSMTPIYQAKVQLFVSTPSSALDVSALVQGSSFSQQRVKSYAQIINGPETLKPVIAKLDLPYSYEKLAKNVTATAPLDTVLISVTVSDPDAYLAARIANAVGQQFALTANDLEISGSSNYSAIKVSMVKTASLPKSPSSPKTSLNILLGLILGFGMGLGLSILRTIFDNTLKNETDLDGTALLASIAFDPSAQEKPLITQISRYAPRTESFRALRTNLQYVRAENPPKVIAVTSAVPGEGKTSTSLNLAISFATSGMKTLLIEADMRRPKIRDYTGEEGKQAGLSDILSGKVQGDIESRLQQVAYNYPDHELTIISSGTTHLIQPNYLTLKLSNTLLSMQRQNLILSSLTVLQLCWWQMLRLLLRAPMAQLLWPE